MLYLFRLSLGRHSSGEGICVYISPDTFQMVAQCLDVGGSLCLHYCKLLHLASERVHTRSHFASLQSSYFLQERFGSYDIDSLSNQYTVLFAILQNH